MKKTSTFFEWRREEELELLLIRRRRASESKMISQSRGAKNIAKSFNPFGWFPCKSNRGKRLKAKVGHSKNWSALFMKELWDWRRSLWRVWSQTLFHSEFWDEKKQKEAARDQSSVPRTGERCWRYGPWLLYLTLLISPTSIPPRPYSRSKELELTHGSGESNQPETHFLFCEWNEYEFSLPLGIEIAAKISCNLPLRRKNPEPGLKPLRFLYTQCKGRAWTFSFRWRSSLIRWL